MSFTGSVATGEEVRRSAASSGKTRLPSNWEGKMRRCFSMISRHEAMVSGIL
ncbi:hypothetical protein KCP73_16685 [Salmonella enterica subsp. enterica]|nr:hypothetical protein KCP73_16685 [Salmonella enterica subsp. enterica]